MTHTINRLTALAVWALMTPAAYAQDKQFDGLFLGGEVGASIVDFGTDGQSGLYYGGLVGFRIQTSNGWVYGIEGALADTDRSFDDDNNFGSIFSLDFKYQWSAAATLGKTFGSGGNNLVFAKLGYNRHKYDFDLPDAVSPPPEFPSSATRDGILIGLGYERALSRSANFRLGVDFADSDDFQQWQPKASLIFRF